MDHFGFVEPVDRLGERIMDGTRSASASRSVYLIETYGTPR